MSRIIKDQLWRCKSCLALIINPDLLTAPSPFDESDILTACPQCKQCDEGFELICDEPDCRSVAVCGWPTENDTDDWGGYRNTCYIHMKRKN